MSRDACPICCGSLDVYLASVEASNREETFSIKRCCQCGLGVTDPIPKDLERYYDATYHGNRHGITARFCDWRRRRLIPKLASSAIPSLLDVGCGDGTFAKSMERCGWQVWGVEKHGAHAQKNDLMVFDSLDQAHSCGPYDCITLWHVLEHLPDLNGSLFSLSRLLKSDGVLILAVPNFQSLQAKFFGKDWLHLDIPRHLYHFTEASLRGLLDRHGFYIDHISYSEPEYDLMGWVQSSLNRYSAEPNAFFKMVTGRAVRLTLGHRIAHWLSGLLLGTAFILPTLVGGQWGFGGTLVASARLDLSRI